MKSTRVQSRVGVSLSAIVILLQISPAVAGGGSNVLPTTPRSGSAITLVAGPDNAGDSSQRVEVTFTKWITDFPLMAGFVEGEVAGDFSGEVLQYQPSLNGRMVRLEAMYEVSAGNRSFTALVRGGQNNETGAAILDGVILGGWRTGARVHVEYKVMTNCAGAPTGTCFQGTIRIERPSQD